MMKGKCLKAEYVSVRKAFDREVQKCKWRYWYNLQNDVLQECDVDQNEFWKFVGRIGLGHSKKYRIPEEILLDNGTVSAFIN